MLKGGYEGYSVNSSVHMRNNPDIEQEKRLSVAYMLATTPEAYEVISKNNVDLFHGTNSNALPSILKYGMNSGAESEKNGITVSTGERSTRGNGQRNFISFTDDLGVALDYAAISPSHDAQKEDSFGVLIGISSNNIMGKRKRIIPSDLPEVGIMDNLEVEKISVIGVPESKVSFVRKLIGDEQIQVVPINMQDRFYYIDRNCGSIFIDEEKAKGIIDGNKQRKKDKSFENEEVKKLAKGRIISEMLGLFKRVKRRFGKER